MHDDNLGSEHKHTRILKWVSAGVVGLFSGLSGAVTQTHLHFHKKLTDSIGRSNLEELDMQDRRIENTLESTELPAAEIEELKATQAAIRKRIHLKEQFDKRAESLDKNFFERIINSFRGDKVDQAAKTEEYIAKATTLKNNFSKEVRDFAQEHLGIESKGFASVTKGSLQRYNFMGKETKLNIIMNGTIATTIGVASTLMFFNSLNTHNKLDQLVRHNNKDSSR